jgi:hypothetical protein
VTTTGDDRHRRMDAARVRAELSIQDLWLRYVALGGTGDAFDLDGYLQALGPLDALQQDVLAQALNEALEDCYRSYRIPLSTLPVEDDGDDRLRQFIDAFLAAPPVAGERDESRTGPAEPG